MNETQERVLAHLSKRRNTARGVAIALQLPLSTVRRVLSNLEETQKLVVTFVGFIKVYERKTQVDFQLTDIPAARAFLSLLHNPDLSWITLGNAYRQYTGTPRPTKAVELLIGELLQAEYIEVNRYSRIRITERGAKWLTH